MSVICILNFSGNVGKSTLNNELFRPRLPNYKFFAIESVNASGSPEEEKQRADDFHKLYEEILLEHENAVLDVGASNAEMFIAKMSENVGSHNDFDLFIVPIPPNEKQVSDSVKTVEILRSLGVPASKITVIFNRIEDMLHVVSDVEIFKDVLYYHEKTKNFYLNEDLAIYKSDAFARARMNQTNIFELASSKEDFKALAKNPEIDLEEKRRLIGLHSSRGISINVHENLNQVFSILNKKFKF